MNRKIMNVLILSVLCIALLPVTGHFENRNVPKAAYTPHEPILINGNAELAALCTVGNGTEANPYIIEGFSFIGGVYGIQIMSTDAYLCIRDNMIADKEVGLIIMNGQNINISRNILSNFTNENDEGLGIMIAGSQNIEISENMITNSHSGIFCSEMTNSLVLSNTFQRILFVGIMLEGSHSNQVSGNINEDTLKGIALDGCRNTVFSNNLFTRSGFTIEGWTENITIDTTNKVNGKSIHYFNGQTGLSFVDEIDVGQLILINVNESEFRGFSVSSTSMGIITVNCKENIFSGLYLSNNTQNGMYMINSTFNSIKLSKFEFNDGAINLDMFNTGNNTIVGNMFKNNKHGISSENSRGNRIYNNSFIGNSQIHVDVSYSNIWDNGAIGNYWDDYAVKYPSATHNGSIWDTPYNVSKMAFFGLFYDNFPLAFDPWTQIPSPILSMVSGDGAGGVKTITLTWNPIEDAGYYLVYRSNSSISSVQGLTPIANMTTTEFTENVPSGTWYYAIVAANELKSSKPSNNVQIEGSTVPEKPGEEEEETPSEIDGFPLAMFGIICVITLIVKRKRIES
jgi:parallel beta-helix repeat protein